MISGATFEVDRKKARLTELEEAAAKEGFWDSPEKAESFLKERKSLETFLAKWTDIAKTLEGVHADLGLGAEAPPDAPPVLRQERVRGRNGRASGRGGGRDQERDLSRVGRPCVRVPEGGERRAPPGADLPVRCEQEAPHLVRPGHPPTRDRTRH